MPAAPIAATATPAASSEGKEPTIGALLAPAERQELQGHLGDDAERALGSDHERGEVVAGRALRGAAAEAHDLAVREHDGHAEHVVARHAVLHAADAARVRGDVAADRRDPVARGVGRIPEAVSGDRLAQVVVDDAGLGDDDRSAASSSSDARHALERDDDRARRRALAPPERPVPAPRATIGMPARAAKRTTAATSSRRLDEHDGERTMELRPLGVVVRVGVPLLGRGEDLVEAEDVAQRRGDGVCGEVDRRA